MKLFFFVPVGSPDVPNHISLWGHLLAARGPLQLYTNIGPAKIFPGIKSPLNRVEPGDLDWIIVRENLEGEYSGYGGRSDVGQPWETATEVAIFTRVGVERIIRFAFETVQERPRKLLTVVTNLIPRGTGWSCWIMAMDFPYVTWDKMLVDAMTVRMVSNPKSSDVIVGTNVHMDILSDLAAALSRSIGIAASSNLDPSRKLHLCLSLFTAVLLTLRAKELLIRWQQSGVRQICFVGLEKRVQQTSL
jgi:isocitrate/isopropylmalate dehydrogenase